MGAAASPVTTGIGVLNSVFGGAFPVLGALNQVAGAVQQVTGDQSRSEQDLALQNLQAQQKLHAAQMAADNTLERERIAVQAQADEETRRAALRRAVARQRAQFGASGVGNANAGSQQAVLLGLFDETEGELAQRERLDNLRNKALDLGMAQQKSLNVLQYEQLRQRQNLGRASSFADQGQEFLKFGLGGLGML